MISLNDLHEILEYVPETGWFIWKIIGWFDTANEAGNAYDNFINQKFADELKHIKKKA